MTTNLTIESAEDVDGKIVVHLKGSQGDRFDLSLSTLDCQSLIQMLKICLEAAANSPPPAPLGVLHLSYIQLREYAETLLIRMAISPQVFHDYDLPLRTTLAQDLLKVMEARGLSQTTHPGSDTSN